MPTETIDPADRARLKRLQAKARRHDMRLHSSRRDGLMLFDASRNALIAGGNHGLDLDGAEEWIAWCIQREAA